jgi:glycine cleavage system H protein
LNNPQELSYSKEHEWARVDGGTAIIGITDYAQNSLGDIVYVELPKAGTHVAQFASIGVVESVKAVSDLFTPLSGEVIEVNGTLGSDPAAVNRDPYGEGWFLKLKLEEPAEAKKLLSASEYDKLTAE